MYRRYTPQQQPDNTSHIDCHMVYPGDNLCGACIYRLFCEGFISAVTALFISAFAHFAHMAQGDEVMCVIQS